MKTPTQDKSKSLFPKHCDNCGSPYNQRDLNLVKKEGPARLYHLRCHNCGNSYMINILEMFGIANRIPLNTDLSTPEEIEKFVGSRAISADDVLDLHIALEDKDKGKEFFENLTDQIAVKKVEREAE